MPPTAVHVAFAGLLAAALLGFAFSGRAVAVVLVAGAFPDLDAVAAVAVEGLHGALLHTLLVPGAVGLIVYYDTRVGEEGSWLRERFGPAGVRTAWVALAAYALAGVGLDLFNVDGAAPLYPLHDQFYSLVGRAELNNQQGFVQTFVEVNLWGPGPLVDFGGRGSTAAVFVHSPLNPVPGPNPPDAERLVSLAESGWQLLFEIAALGLLWTRFRLRAWGVA